MKHSSQIRNAIAGDLIALLILALFMVFGRKVLEFMHLSETSLSIAGGIILFMIAIRMVDQYLVQR